MSELNLLELWFAATCGVELPAQHRSNDSPSLDTAIAVGMDTSKSHSLIENSAAILKTEDALVEKGLNQGDGDSAARDG
jgi:hypothetical protein